MMNMNLKGVGLMALTSAATMIAMLMAANLWANGLEDKFEEGVDWIKKKFSRRKAC